MMLEPIVVETTLDAPAPQAFDAFVSRIGDWWPMRPFSMAEGLVSLQPVLGGQIIETATSGEVFVWGHVTAIDRPHLLELAWYVGRSVDTATQISVTFEPLGAAQTRLRLIQSGWEALGDAAAEMRTRNDAGWRRILIGHFSEFLSSDSKEPPHV